jgi:hypothetical protein
MHKRDILLGLFKQSASRDKWAIISLNITKGFPLNSINHIGQSKPIAGKVFLDILTR